MHRKKPFDEILGSRLGAIDQDEKSIEKDQK